MCKLEGNTKEKLEASIKSSLININLFCYNAIYAFLKITCTLQDLKPQSNKQMELELSTQKLHQWHTQKWLKTTPILSM